MKNALRSLPRLGHVAAVARHGSYSHAAIELNLSQSALSRSIQAIEADLGIVLFERSRSGVALTPPGQLFVRKARELLAAAHEFERTMQLIHHGDRDPVSFGMGPLPASFVLPRLFKDNLAAKTPVKLQCHVETGMVLRGLLESGAIEFVVCAQGAIEPRTNLVNSTIARVPIQLRVRQGHPLNAHETISVADLAAYPMVGGGLTPALSGEIIPGSIIYDPIVTCDNYDLLAKVVVDTDALCIFATGFETPQLATLAVAPIPSFLEIELIQPEGRRRSEDATHVIDQIRRLLAG